MNKTLTIAVVILLTLSASVFPKSLTELTENDLSFPAKVLLDLAKTELGMADHISGISIGVEDEDGLYAVYGLCHGYSYQGDLMEEWYVFAHISRDLKQVLGRGHRIRWSPSFKLASGPIKMKFPIKVQGKDAEKLIRKRLWDFIQDKKTKNKDK